MFMYVKKAVVKLCPPLTPKEEINIKFDDCEGVVLEISMDHKFQWPQEGVFEMQTSYMQFSYLNH